MMLIADNTAKAIHRFDPMNRTYLGSFGQSSLTSGAITATAIDQASNRMYVAQGGFVSEFDYNTGEQTRVVFATGTITSLCVRTPGELFLSYSSSTQVVRYLYSSNSFSTYAVPSGAVNVSSVATDGTHVYALGAGNGLLSKYVGTSSSSLVGSVTISGLVSDTAGPLEYLPSNQLVITNRTERLAYTYTSGLGSRTTLLLNALSTASGAARGHEDFRYAYGTLTTGGLGYQRSIVNGNGGTSFAAQSFPSQIQDVQSIVTVVAPEPGSLVAITFGAIMLLRRRRR